MNKQYSHSKNKFMSFHLVIFSLLIMVVIACDNNDWNIACQQGTIIAFEDFIMKHPESSHAVEAVNEIWNLTVKHNQIKEYEVFLNRYATSEHRKEAENGIWNLTKKENNIQAYERFIEMNISSYKEEAKQTAALLCYQEGLRLFLLGGFQNYENAALNFYHAAIFVPNFKDTKSRIDEAKRRKWEQIPLGPAKSNNGSQILTVIDSKSNHHVISNWMFLVYGHLRFYPSEGNSVENKRLIVSPYDDSITRKMEFQSKALGVEYPDPIVVYVPISSISKLNIIAPPNGTRNSVDVRVGKAEVTWINSTIAMLNIFEFSIKGKENLGGFGSGEFQQQVQEIKSFSSSSAITSSKRLNLINPAKIHFVVSDRLNNKYDLAELFTIEEVQKCFYAFHFPCDCPIHYYLRDNFQFEKSGTSINLKISQIRRLTFLKYGPEEQHGEKLWHTNILLVTGDEQELTYLGYPEHLEIIGRSHDIYYVFPIETISMIEHMP